MAMHKIANVRVNTWNSTYMGNLETREMISKINHDVMVLTVQGTIWATAISFNNVQDAQNLADSIKAAGEFDSRGFLRRRGKTAADF